MPFYLGLPIAVCLWIAIVILSFIAISTVIDLIRNITSYNKELDKASQTRIGKDKQTRQ